MLELQELAVLTRGVFLVILCVFMDNIVRAIQETKTEIFAQGNSPDCAVAFLKELVHFYSPPIRGKLNLSKVAKKIGVPRSRLQYLLEDPTYDFQDRLIKVILPLIVEGNRRISYYFLSAKGIGNFGLENVNGLTDSFGIFGIGIDEEFYPLMMTEGPHDVKILQFVDWFKRTRLAVHPKSFFFYVTERSRVSGIFNGLPEHLSCAVVLCSPGEFILSEKERETLRVKWSKNRQKEIYEVVTSEDGESSLFIKTNRSDNLDKHLFKKIETICNLHQAKKSWLASNISGHFENFRTKNGTKSNISQVSRLALFISIAKMSVVLRKNE